MLTSNIKWNKINASFSIYFIVFHFTAYVRTRWNKIKWMLQEPFIFYFILFCVKCPDITTRFHWNCCASTFILPMLHTLRQINFNGIMFRIPVTKVGEVSSLALWSFNRTVGVFLSISPRRALFRSRYVESREKVQVPCYSCVQIIGAHNKPSADAVSGGSLLRHINPRGSTRREYETTAMRDGAGHRQANISSQFKNPSRNHFRTPWRPRGYRSSAA